MRTLSLILLVAVGCTPTNSNTVPTSQLAAQITVSADGTGQTTVQTALFSHASGSPPLNEDSIDLVDGDSLTASSDGSSLAMTQSFTTVVDEFTYSAVFPSDGPGESFSVVLTRTQDESAGPSTATLPDPFTLTAASTASRSQPLTVTWSPSGTSDAISVAFVGCGDATTGTIADTGTATFAADALTSSTSACSGYLTVTRSRNGTLADAYGQGGAITASQVRTQTIATTP
jgi:hypothetical protein